MKSELSQAAAAVLLCLSFCVLEPPALADEAPELGGLKAGDAHLDVAPQPASTAASVFVAAHPGTSYSRGANHVIELQEGAVVVSVRPPAEMATVVTDLGNVSIAAGADALVAVRAGAIKVQCLRGMQESVTAMLDKTKFAHMGRTVLPIAPGRELVASTSGPPRPAAAAAAAAPATAPVAGGYALGESTAASLSATALVMGAIDNAITNEQQRRYLRDVAEETTLAPYWKNVRASRQSIEGAAGAAMQAADALKAAPGPAAAPAPVSSPHPAAAGHATAGDAHAGAGDDDGRESLGSILGNEGAAEAARSGAEESRSSDWLSPVFADGPSEGKGEAGGPDAGAASLE